MAPSYMMRATTWCLCFIALGACDCRSDVEGANQVFELAESVTDPAPELPADVNPVDIDEDPCPQSSGDLIVSVSNGDLYDVQVAGDTLYWLGRSLFSHAAGESATLAVPEWPARLLRVTPLGAFAVTQRPGSAQTRLFVRGSNGALAHALEREDVLLTDIVASDEGVFALAGRVLSSQGGASQLLRYSIREGREEVMLDLERGALFLARDAERLYWLEHAHAGRGQSGPSAVVSYEIANAQRVVLAEIEGKLSALALGQEHLYWIQRPSLMESHGRLMRMSKTGGAAEVVHESLAAYQLLVADDGFVYAHVWDPTDPDAARRRLHRIDPSSGEASLVVEDPHSIAFPRIAGDVLYWATRATRDAPHRCLRALRL